MESGNPRTVRCNYCNKEEAVPPGARTIWCTYCSRSIRIRRGFPGFVKKIVANISSGVASALSGYAAASSNAGTMPRGCEHLNPTVAYRPRSYLPEQRNKKRAVLIGVSYVGRRYERKGTVNDVNCMSYLLCTLPRARDCEYLNPTVAYRPRSYLPVPEQRNKKRAVLIGVSYVGRRYELKGTVNDVNCMSYLLCTKFGFSRECILVLTEEEGDPGRIPTTDNVRAAMRWLVHGCSAGDSLVFHFSGHGVQKLDVDSDERDGFDEALCPLDFEENGIILDDEINATIVRPLPRDVKLHAVVDACHSGTILDLPFLCRLLRTGVYQWEDHRPPSMEYKGTNGGLAILISGCDDHQTSADTSAFARSTSTGAMTYSFIQAVESEQANTYGNLLTAMRSSIRNGLTGGGISGPIASLFRRVLTYSSTQEPQLSSSKEFNIYEKPFHL